QVGHPTQACLTPLLSIHNRRERGRLIWRIEYADHGFERFLRALPGYERAVAIAAIEHVLRPHGIDVVGTRWAKALGEGLYEFRIRNSLRTVLSSASVAYDARRGE